MRKLLLTSFTVVLLALLLLIFSPLLNKIQAQLQQMTLLKWNFDEPSGSGIYIQDDSGYGNYGLVQDYNNGRDDPLRISGKKGSAIRLSGLGDYIGIGRSGPDKQALQIKPNKLTVNIWINPSSYPDRNDNFMRWILGNDKTGNDKTGKGIGGYALRLGKGDSAADFDKLTFVWRSKSGPLQRLVGKSSIPLNSWTFVSATLDGQGNARIYINGVLDGEILRGGPITYAYDGINPFEVGRRSQTGLHVYDGLLDQLTIYNYVRTPAQILNDFNNP